MKQSQAALFSLLVLSLATLGIEACSSEAKLTPAGNQVGLSRKAAASDCQTLGAVDDTPYDKAKLYTNMRNKAGEMGGTYVMLTEEFHDKLGSRVIGTAYKCPPTATVTK